MGVAAGRFLPYSAYSAIQPSVMESRDDSQAHLALVIRLTDGGEIPSEGGVRITDYSVALGNVVFRIIWRTIPALFGVVSALPCNTSQTVHSTTTIGTHKQNPELTALAEDFSLLAK